MSYFARPLPRRKNNPKWKIQFVVFQKAPNTAGPSRAKRRTWDVPRDRWRSLGFHAAMDLADAKARVRQLNAQAQLKRQEERIRKLEQVEREFRVRHDAALPEEFVNEFEKRFFRPREGTQVWRRDRIKRRNVTWRAAQKMIVATGIEPSERFYNFYSIYDYFFEQQLGIGYIAAVIRVANLWGFFYCRKLARPFLPVPLPKGRERQRLIDAYYQREKRVRRPSLPLTTVQLAQASAKLNRPNFNWIYLSVWFGLRPHEIDNLRDSQYWDVETLPTGRKVLWVFQTKIIALPPEDRWKPIPILFSEQEFGLKIIADQTFKRPLNKTMRLHFGSGFDLYAGRKGFVDHMLEKGHSLENISIWMVAPSKARGRGKMT